MSITDELRKFANDWDWVGCTVSVSERKLLAIADRIDAEHEHELDHVRNQASEGLAKQWNYGYDVGFASADDWLEQHEGAMAEHGWIRLPKDADGEYIHIGDMMECDKLPNGKRVCGEVKAISNDCVWLINEQYKIHAKYLHHHHEPTVEDVLREFALEIDPSADIAVTGAETIKKFAAKLQLKEPNE